MKIKNLFKSRYEAGWDNGIKVGARTTIRVVINMLEREQYKNKGADPYYDYALKSIIEKVKELDA